MRPTAVATSGCLVRWRARRSFGRRPKRCVHKGPHHARRSCTGAGTSSHAESSGGADRWSGRLHHAECTHTRSEPRVARRPSRSAIEEGVISRRRHKEDKGNTLRTAPSKERRAGEACGTSSELSSGVEKRKGQKEKENNCFYILAGRNRVRI